MEYGPKYIRISCFGYSKNIPIEKDYQIFLISFMQKFNLSESQIKNIIFQLYFYNENTKVNIPMELQNQEKYYEYFRSDDNIGRQFTEITGKAIFEGSDQIRPGESDPVLTSSQYLNNNNNNNFNDIFQYNKNNNYNDIIQYNDINNNKYNDIFQYNNKFVNNNYGHNNMFNFSDLRNILDNNKNRSHKPKKINNNDNFNSNEYNDYHNYHNQGNINRNFNINHQNNLNNYNNLSEFEKNKIIHKLEKEIKKLTLEYEEEKKKNIKYKQKYENFGIVKKKAFPEKRFDSFLIYEPSFSIPFRLQTKRRKKEVSNIQNYKYQKEKNIIEKEISEIKKGESIQTTIQLIKTDKHEYWNDSALFFCIPDDSDIYFNHVKINDRLNVKKEEEANTIIYQISIGIKFKNYRTIKSDTEYILYGQMICDSDKNIKTNIEKIIVKVVNNKIKDSNFNGINEPNKIIFEENY